MKKVIIIVVALIVLAGVGYVGAKAVKHAMRSSSTPAVTQITKPSIMMNPSVTMAPSATGSASGASMGAVKEITVSGQNFSFTPNTISVNKGDKVKLTFTSAGGIHDFVIDELNVQTKKIQGGATDTVEFTADKAGTFEFYCSVGNHRAMGMKGMITVH